MIKMTLDAIALACNGNLYEYKSSKNTNVSGVAIDSRLIENNFLFIATKGEHVDGHHFIDDAFDKGAAAVICEKAPTNPKGTYILVENSLIALKDIAKYYRMQLDVKIIGITGSVGKTSTKEFISSVLSRKYDVLKTEGNYNNEIGMPLTLLKIRNHHQIAILEMGINDFNEMHRLSEIAKPDIVVITNIGECHLEKLGSRVGVLKAKTEIFDFISENGKVIINGDDDMLSTIDMVGSIKPIRFGLDSKNDIFANNLVSKGLLGSSFDIHINNKSYKTNIPLPGQHMVYNALAAASVGLFIGMNYNEILLGFNEVKTLNGRSNVIQSGNQVIIDDCYNANPISMRAAIDLLAMANGRKVAILGDMFELGKDENILHNEIGRYASTRLDLLICVGELSYHMYEGALENSNTNILYFKTRDELINQLSSIIRSGDTILVKASNGMKFNEIIKFLH
ncbi:MAG TPA: UDP-N-acetylmuramoyl-tripeptide--D-alanyl-D-alanine ligase [Clostridiales bacterium]|nr:UDP-N-acetylmuramoyl-tripeptide--D-alanyl-D-alanine ligase [Clostridiales bacterium]